MARARPAVKHVQRLLRLAGALLALAAASGCAGIAAPRERLYTFHLSGGYFYGPGPIVPDTELPNGRLVNIHFDPGAFSGYAKFSNDGSKGATLSDGKTRINQNIDAGHLHIGGGFNTVLLAAVDGGPHRGAEEYYLDEDYRFVWRVDLALDPGFEEGIIRVDDFILHTGVARIAPSLQTRRGVTGGYDQAGSLNTGQLLLGRLGDFDQDGFLDGILVAAPNVPLAADLLPGAPVGNRRGFHTDIPIAPSVSAELILRGVLDLAPALTQAETQPDRKQYEMLLRDAVERAAAARVSLERIPPRDAESTRRRALEQARAVERSATAAFESVSGPAAPAAAVTRLLSDARAALDAVIALNREIGQALPARRRPSVLAEAAELKAEAR